MPGGFGGNKVLTRPKARRAEWLKKRVRRGELAPRLWRDSAGRGFQRGLAQPVPVRVDCQLEAVRKL